VGECSKNYEQMENVVGRSSIIKLAREKTLMNLEQIEDTSCGVQPQHLEITVTHLKLIRVYSFAQGQMSERDDAERYDRTKRDRVRG
jgi:hypothetical protein